MRKADPLWRCHLKQGSAACLCLLYAVNVAVCCSGYTPLEVCALEMEYQRECSEARPSGFTGHEDRYMQVIKLLDKAGGNGKSVVPIPKSKLGCTCGQCFSGFLSPRTRLRSVLPCVLESKLVWCVNMVHMAMKALLA